MCEYKAMRTRESRSKAVSSVQHSGPMQTTLSKSAEAVLLLGCSPS